jgi:vitamin B12 transporter
LGSQPFSKGLVMIIAMLAAVEVRGDDQTDPVLVTATRIPETADESLSSVTVITREDIERAQARTVMDILTGNTGIDMTNQGGPGQITSMFMRGTNSGDVTVLVDGVRMGSATSGTFAWEFLPLSQVERIEIVRGPNSALYGSDAIGGVVQIFTRQGGEPSGFALNAGAGRYHTYDVGAETSGTLQAGDTWYSLRLARFSTQGFDARQPFDDPFSGLLDEPDRDGYDNNSLSARFGHRFNSGLRLDINGMNAVGSTQYDSQFANEDQFLQQAIGGSLETTLDDWDTKLSMGRSLDHRKSFRSGDSDLPPARFDTERLTFSWQNDYSFGNTQVATAGIDYHDDRVSGDIDYDKTSRYTAAIFGQYRGEFGANTFLVRLRPLKDQQFGRKTTGNIAWGYQFADTARFTVSYGSAFKSPTFNDLYFPGFGNPDLKPEESRSLELGVKGRQTWGDWEFSAYRTRIDDLIIFSFESLLPENVDSAKIEGLEASTSAVLLGWEAKCSATLVNPTDESSGNVLPRRARRTARIEVDRTFGRAGVGATLLAQSARYDDKANTIRVGGYGLLDLRAQYRFDSHWTVRARLENVFDKQYQTVATYNEAGRNLFVSVNYDSR